MNEPTIRVQRRTRSTLRWIRRQGPVACALACLLVGFAPPASPATLFALVDTGELFASPDFGETWSVRSALPTSDAIGLVAVTSASDLYLTGSTGGVYHSTDAGETWVAVGSVPASDVAAVAAASDGTLLLLTVGGVIWASSDGGTSFDPRGALTGSDHVALASDPAALHALTKAGVATQSLDQGVTWQIKGEVTAPDAVGIVSIGTFLYVLTETGEVWRSDDGGGTWVPIGTLSQVHMSGFCCDGAANLFAVTREGEVARSQNGTDWTWVGVVNQLEVVSLATDTPAATSVPDEVPSLPFAAGAPIPNPVGADRSVTFPIQLAAEGQSVRVQLFDASGRQVAARAPEQFGLVGSFSLRWDLSGVPPGVYIARLTSGPWSTSRKTVLLD